MVRNKRMSLVFVLGISAVFTARARAEDIVKIDLIPGVDRNVLVLSHSGHAKFRMFQSERQGTVIVEAEGLSVPARLTRMIDISSSNGPVTQVTPYNSMNGKVPMAKLVLQLRQTADVTSSEQPGKFLVEIRRKASSLPYIGRTGLKKAEQWAGDKVVGHLSATAKSEEVAKHLVEVLNAPPEEKKYFGSKVTFEANQADVHDVFRLVGEASELNIISDSDVNAKANFSLKDIPWDQLLDIVIQQGNLKAMVMGNVIRITSLETFNKQAEAKKKEITLSDELEPVIMAVIPLSFADVGTMQDMISGLLQERSSSNASASLASSGSAPRSVSPTGTADGASGGIEGSLSQDFQRGKVKVDARSNSLVITNTKDAIERIRRLVKELDVPLPQVLVDAKIVIATEKFSRSIGLNWGAGVRNSAGRSTPVIGFNGTTTVASATTRSDSDFSVTAPSGGLGSTFSMGTTPRAGLTATLELAELNSLTKTVASPRIIVNNKKAATIADNNTVTLTQPGAGSGGSSSTSVSAGLSLSVTPQVTSHGSVQMTVAVAKGALDSVVAGTATTSNKSLNTDVLVDSGSTLVLGGIYQVDNGKGENGIPLLKDLPFIGQAFRTNSYSVGKSELMVFITPQIIDPEASSQAL